MLTSSISLDSQVTAIRDQVSSNLGGEAVILHVGSGSYYGLNEVGTRIWELVQRPSTIAAIRDEILNEYEVEVVQLEKDLSNILHQLLEKGLVEITNDTVA